MPAARPDYQTTPLLALQSPPPHTTDYPGAPPTLSVYLKSGGCSIPPRPDGAQPWKPRRTDSFRGMRCREIGRRDRKGESGVLSKGMGRQTPSPYTHAWSNKRRAPRPNNTRPLLYIKKRITTPEGKRDRGYVTRSKFLADNLSSGPGAKQTWRIETFSKMNTFFKNESNFGLEKVNKNRNIQIYAIIAKA